MIKTVDQLTGKCFKNKKESVFVKVGEVEEIEKDEFFSLDILKIVDIQGEEMRIDFAPQWTIHESLTEITPEEFWAKYDEVVEKIKNT